MRNRVERLRLWLLAGAGLLVLVLATFIGSARYLRRHVLAKVANKLGANIKVETNGVTLSHTSLGGTVYKIQASRQDELTDGKIALHDASIMLYGAKQNRSDRIYGDEFEYDPNAGVLRAIGLVHIDMQAAEATGAGQSQKQAPEPPDKTPAAHESEVAEGKILHATTSGLVYMDKLGVAATSEKIDFQLHGMTGHAIGADYSSDTDVLMLHSAVYVAGTPGGRPLVLTASSAVIDNRNQVTFLTHAKYVSMGESVEADQATLHTRPDGSLARIEAQGNVTSTGRGAKVVSARADVTMDAQGQPQSTVLTGNVVYFSDEPLRQRRGEADSAVISFDGQKKPQPEHAVFVGSVHMTERTRATEAVKEPWSVRDLTAAKVEVALVSVKPGKSEPRDVEATGSSHLTVVNNGSLESARGEGRTELAGDELKMHLVATSDAREPVWPETLAGRGHTLLRQLNAEGLEQTSSGDTLDARFKPFAAGGGGAKAGNGIATGQKRQITDTLLSAVQEGHVTMMRRVPAGSSTKAGATPAGKANAADDVEHAIAARAVYDGDLDRVLLTGSVQLTDADSVLWANQVALDHKTGDAKADGAVKVNYVQDSSTGPAHKADAEPAHILADRAELNHATEVGTFYGNPARLWQGGNQVQAPVLEFARAQKRLIGRGEAGSNAKAGVPEVHTVLVSAGSGANGSDVATGNKAGASKTGTCKPGAVDSGTNAVGSVTGKATGTRPPQLIRIASRQVLYSDLLRKAEFTGGVRVESADGTMVAHEATAYLQAAGTASNPQNGGAGAGLSLDGRVERVTATGKIEIEQPGFRATGNDLVYTQSDGLYVLTGESSMPAKIVDAQGSTTGAAFQFHSGDCSVEALSVVPGEKNTGQQVRTDSTINNDRKSGIAKH